MAIAESTMAGQRSEKDEIESECTHAALFFDGVLAAVSRLQTLDSEGQMIHGRR